MSGVPGPFVYRGAGKKQAPNADKCVVACKRYACEIQLCLSRNNQMQKRCEQHIHAWNDCCERVKASGTDEKDDK